MLENGINLHSLVGERKHRSLKAHLRNVTVDGKKEAHVARAVTARYLCELKKPETFAAYWPKDVLQCSKPDPDIKLTLETSIPFCTEVKICGCVMTDSGVVKCGDALEVGDAFEKLWALGKVVGTFAAYTCMGTVEPYLLLHEWVPTGAEGTWGMTAGKHVCMHAASNLQRLTVLDLGGGCHRIRPPHLAGHWVVPRTPTSGFEDRQNRRWH